MGENVITDCIAQPAKPSLSKARDNTPAQTANTQASQPLFARDTLFAQYFSAAPQFCFDAQVAAVFPDMIRRSVPGYGTALELIPAIAAQCLGPGDRVYDLGCSVGAGLLSVREAISQFNLCNLQKSAHTPQSTRQPIHLVGIDTAPEMLERAEILFDTLAPNVPAQPTEKPAPYHVQFHQSDITLFSFEPAKLVLLNYTLQFLALDAREKLINDIYHALVPGGCLMLSEKVVDSDEDTEQHLISLHELFKRSQGYSVLEVARKRESLENVLVREKTSAHVDRLQSAGFSSITPIMQCLQFKTFLAIK